ncbi:MAG: hypothetical protein ACFFDW_03605, partial [Candidatus Thorarchaeota archaeon]
RFTCFFAGWGKDIDQNRREYDHPERMWWALTIEYLMVIRRTPEKVWAESYNIFEKDMDKTVPEIIYNNHTSEIEIYSQSESSIYWFLLQNDTDLDLLGDIDELYFASDPNNPDSDLDGLTDGEEVEVYSTNPIMIDTDWDNVTDGLEVLTYKSNPLSTDTDRDGIWDGDEIYIYHTDPTLKDSDEDLLFDYNEIFEIGTSPINPDTDADGMDDYYEYINGLNPLLDDSESDPDEDGLNNLGEYLAGTDVYNPDTDLDLLSDGEEVITYLTNPLDADTDTDTLTDWEEIMKFSTSPFLADTDADGFTDREEIEAGTDPNDPNDNIRIRFIRTTLIASLIPTSILITVIIFIEVKYRRKIKQQTNNEIPAIQKAEEELEKLREEKQNNHT